MSDYRNAIKYRLILLIICTAVSIALVYVGTLLTTQAETASSTFTDGFTKGFPLGLFSGFVAVMIFLIVRCIRALGNDEYLKKLFITENDERKKMIRQRATGMSFFFTAGILIVGVTVASFFDNVVTLTLMAVLTVHVLTGSILKLYYFLKF